ncbi:MAG: DUF559 domain-containing protein [Candidatus Aureabacteria bacterium]|nr:DUF559 domain-containing protein [Candidatus Auribacterota bacterium]
MKPAVLIGVLRSERDRDILLRRGWYRIPCRRRLGVFPTHLAFYRTARGGAPIPGIALYARVRRIRKMRRSALLPEEPVHPRARDWYWKFELEPLRRLPRIVRNLSRTRVAFIRTTLGRLRAAREIREIFDIPPLEEITGRIIAGEGILFRPQFCVMDRGRCRYRLDFALFAPRARVAVECDHTRWHRLPPQRRKDHEKNRWLLAHGWRVLRFGEEEIVKRPEEVRRKIREAISARLKTSTN